MKILNQLLFLLIATYCVAQPANTDLSNTIYFGGEPYLAVNPTNPQNIIVAWMALDASTNYKVAIKSKVSFDGGTTWGNQFIQPHFSKTWYSADVSMQFRRNGTVYLTYIDYNKAVDSGGVYITHSINGGISWSAPTQIWNAKVEAPNKIPLDRPWLAVDNSKTTNDGAFFITTKPAPWIAPPNRPYLKTSIDSGKTWSAYRYVDTTNYLVGNIIAAPMAFPTVSADGALCIAYPSYLSTQSVYPKYILAKSYNHGSSFQYYNLLVNPTSVNDTLYKLGYRLATNPSDANQMAFAFVAKTYGDPDIFVTTTNNGGLSWNTPARVNDDATGNGKAQDMVWMNYDNKNKLIVTWRDRRNGSGTGFYQPSDTYCATSSDNGTSFKTNIRLSNSTAAFDSILEQSGNDFLSCELANDTIYAAWGDVRSGNLNIYFSKTSDSTGISTGIISVDENEALTIYPNPTNDKLVLHFNDGSIKQIELKVFSESGQEVLSRQLENNSAQLVIDVSKLGTGIYFVSATTHQHKVYSRNIIVSKNH